MIDLDKLQAAAEAATAGPWRWELNLKHKSAELTGGRPTFDLTVMDFVRWGMGGAAPRFNTEQEPGLMLMTRCDELGAVEPGREHHAKWFQRIDHPDAKFMEAANPAVVLELIGRLRAAEARFPGTACVVVDTAPAAIEGAIRTKLIELGWAPPEVATKLHDNLERVENELLALKGQQ